MSGLKLNTFTKILLLIVFLLLPILGLYAASNAISVRVVNEEVRTLKVKDLRFYANQIENNLVLFSTLGLLLSEDINIRQLQTLDLISSTYEKNEAILRLLERLRLLNVSTGWETRITVYAPEAKQVISTDNAVTFDEPYLRKHITSDWSLNAMKVFRLDEDRFRKFIVQPLYFAGRLENAGIIVELTFSKNELVRSLDMFKEGGKGDPFFYKPGSPPVMNQTADAALIGQVVSLLPADRLEELSNKTVSLGANQYLLNVIQIPSLDLYLVDYEPIGQILQPIVQSRNLFYVALITLLFMGGIAAFILYQQVQVPIAELVKGVQIIKRGDYSARIRMKPNNEFDFLFRRFNEMAAEIDNLIRTVYLEQLRSREANLKQLQSQINPHFLYNCFALIRSMARLGEKQSVMDLAMHLSKYYRYTTRLEKQTSTIGEELALITSYLEIQKLHLQRLDYKLDVPESMLKLEIPRLLLQPLVENAILHGIEPVFDFGVITITGVRTETECFLKVKDNGKKMAPEDESKLLKAMLKEPVDGSGCALWNTRQRIRLFFGEGSDLVYRPAEPKGVEMAIRWKATGRAE